MKLSINLKSLSILGLLRKNVSIGLWAFLLVVVIAEGFVIYTEVGKISQVQSDPNVVQSQIVRVNLDQHEKLEKYLDDNKAFEPRVIPGGSSFDATPAPGATP